MIRIVFASVLLLARLSAAAQVELAHVRNFGQVNQNLFRGGMPTGDALQELKALGVGLIIDLREEGAARQAEKEKVEQLGMRYEHVPMRALSAPRPSDIQQVLSLILRDPSAKVYVHCLRGKDRTGTVIACYRIQHDGWDNERALAEAKDYGMSHLEKAMQSFILHFAPLTLPAVGAPSN
jgi:protein tyrosine/serine phosphatase